MASTAGRAGVVVVVVAALGWSPATRRGCAGDVLGMLARGLAAPVAASHRRPPATAADCAVERLADEIDWLERHVDRFGSIVAKHPDVWGQNRLTRHRAEYERLLEREKDAFREITNASLRRSDQSFLGLALAIQNSVAESSAAGARTGTPPFQTVTTLISTQSGTRDPGVPLDRTPPFAAGRAAGLPAVGTGPTAGGEIGLEPTIHLDHLDRYVRHLQELRRINEGDDIADSPGYALALVRMPVSILPGKQTQRGHGAEISVIADLQLGDDLLPATFRTLATNDVVDVLAPPLAHAVNDPAVVAEAVAATRPEPGGAPVPPAAARRAARTSLLPLYPSVQTRRARLPFPREQLVEVIGYRQFLALVAGADEALRVFPASAPCIQYTDVRGWLGEELQAAHELLRQDRQLHLWGDCCGPRVAELVRSRQAAELAGLRCRFFAELGHAVPPVPCEDGGCFPEDPPDTPRCRTTTAILAWAILVESALLNERLVDDIRESASTAGLAGGDAGRWAAFYGPSPPPEARRAFNDYVRRRWPVRVFALDPVTQEQTVEDLFAMRRETQIALALAASGGRLSPQAMMRYARRLETDMATVALNKTAVGFSHGNDTFGWRFYPRVQSPPVRNGVLTFADALVGSNSSNRDLAERRIEPGMRECTALVVVPSFVPTVTFDVRTNWFSLTHPQQTDRSMRRTLELSRSVKAMQQAAAACEGSVGPYRDGEVARLLRRVEQLDRELPLQTMRAAIPYENTSGGFELFATGVTDLAPELIGWYGARGIDPAAETVVYLVGKGFSIHDTSIVAGGVDVPVELVSRQVLRARFPAGIRARRFELPQVRGEAACPHVQLSGGRSAGLRPWVVPAGGEERAPEPLPAPGPSIEWPRPPEAGPAVDPRKLAPATSPPPDAPSGGCPCQAEPDAVGVDCHALEVVDVRLATPYGVSNHLLIPVVSSGDAAGGGGLSFVPDVSLTLFSERAATSGAWRIQEYYEATRPEIVVRAPGVFIPPGRATLRFLLRQRQGDAFATISIEAPPFDGRAGVYRLAGADLRNFVGDGSRPAADRTLRGALAPFVNHAGGRPAVFDAEATLVTPTQEIPIGGGLTVRIGNAPAAGPGGDEDEAPSPAG